MTFFLILVCLALCFCILQNGLQLGAYRKEAAKALRVYEPHGKGWKVLKAVFIVLGALFLIGLVLLLLFNRDENTADQCLTLLALALFCVLYAFTPYTMWYWCLSADGLYSYRLRKLLPWSEFVQVGTLRRKKKMFISVQVKKAAGDTFKQVYYAFPIEAEDEPEAREIIREFMHTLERARMMRRDAQEKATPLKERKWY